MDKITVQILEKRNGRVYGRAVGGFADKKAGLQYAQEHITNGYRAYVFTNGHRSCAIKCGRVF